MSTRPVPQKIGFDFANHIHRTPASTAPGVDLLAGVGTQVKSFSAGRVCAVKDTDTAPAGRYINIEWRDRGDHFIVRQLHLSRIDVRVGDDVREGQVNALSGRSGGVDPHLHFSILKNGAYVDPEPLMPTVRGAAFAASLTLASGPDADHIALEEDMSRITWSSGLNSWMIMERGHLRQVPAAFVSIVNQISMSRWGMLAADAMTAKLIRATEDAYLGPVLAEETGAPVDTLGWTPNQSNVWDAADPSSPAALTPAQLQEFVDRFRDIVPTVQQIDDAISNESIEDKLDQALAGIVQIQIREDSTPAEIEATLRSVLSDLDLDVTVTPRR